MHYLNNWGKKAPQKCFNKCSLLRATCFAQNTFGMVNTPWGNSPRGCSGKKLIRAVWCVVLINAESGKGFPILPHPGLAVCWPGGAWDGGMVHLSPSAWKRHLWPSLHTLTGVWFRKGQQQAQPVKLPTVWSFVQTQQPGVQLPSLLEANKLSAARLLSLDNTSGPELRKPPAACRALLKELHCWECELAPSLAEGEIKYIFSISWANTVRNSIYNTWALPPIILSRARF